MRADDLAHARRTAQDGRGQREARAQHASDEESRPGYRSLTKMTTNATTRAKATVAHRIATINKGRDPERLRLKYEAMRNSPFAFLRGTCHLFYEDWAHDHVIDTAPLAWI